MFRWFRKLFRRLLAWRYKHRNCENCPISHAGYESHDFDSCDIYGDDFQYEGCPYIWLPQWFVKRKADKLLQAEADGWFEYAKEQGWVSEE